MDLEYFILGGYGLFIWPAFIFTFISCFYLYLRSIKELKKQEVIFYNEFRQMQNLEIIISKQHQNPKKVLSGNSVI